MEVFLTVYKDVHETMFTNKNFRDSNYMHSQGRMDG